jgi:hypothetical protein
MTEETVEEYLRRGGRVTRCPTACAEVVEGYVPSKKDRRALAKYHKAQDAKPKAGNWATFQ